MFKLIKEVAKVNFSEFFGGGGFQMMKRAGKHSVIVRNDMVEKLKEPVTFVHIVEGKEVCSVDIDFIIVKGDTIAELRNLVVHSESNRGRKSIKYKDYGMELAAQIEKYLNSEVIEGILPTAERFTHAIKHREESVLIGVKEAGRHSDFIVNIEYDVEPTRSFKKVNMYEDGILYLFGDKLMHEVKFSELVYHLHNYAFVKKDHSIIVNGEKCYMTAYEGI